MAVVFDWIVHNQRYRVRREVILQPSKTVVNLDFGIITEQGTFKPLSDKTIRATQERITATIGLDYEGFIASAFLRQGNSHEFSRRAPQERKELLAQILGLSQYEVLRKHALIAVREREQKRERTYAQEQFLASAPETHTLMSARVQEREALRTTLTTEKAALASQRNHAAQKIAHVTVQREQYRIIAQRTPELRTMHDELYAKLRTLLPARTSKTVSNGRSPEQLTQEYIAARAVAEQLHAAYARSLTFRQELLTLEQALHNRRAALIEHSAAERTTLTATYERALSREKILAEHCATLTTQLQTEPSAEQIVHEQKHIARYESARTRFSAALSACKAQQALAITFDTRECPVCTQSLTAQQAQSLAHRHDAAAHRIARLKKIIPILEQRITHHSGKLNTLLRAQEQHAERAKEWAQRTQEHAHAQSERIAAEQILTQRTAHHEHIRTTDSQIGAYITRAEEITRELATAPTIEQCAGAEQMRRTLEEELSRYASLDIHRTQRAQARHEIRSCIAKIRTLITEIQSATHALEKEQELATQIHRESVALEHIQKQIAELEFRERENERELGTASALKEKAAQDMKLLAAAHTEREALDREITLYRGALQVLSKDGIPALLIEEALPELEQSANDLLARLTDNQSHLRFESIRDLKNGGTRETLDIIISDALGTRPYEMFSGGEAFRIDFALRVALSQLLARKAGTTLQTLIIDEGFGSQDEEGLGRIMDAIYRVQDQFAKILIVSHLPAMRDQFPVHFQVTKGPTGSAISVIEQG